VLERLPAAVYVNDKSTGKALFANHAMSRLLGTAEARDLPALNRYLVGKAGDRRDARGRSYLEESDQIPWLDGRKAELRVFFDVTEHRRVVELERAQLELQHQSAKSISLAEMASTLAHELNQPLVAIAAYSDAASLILSEPALDRPALEDAVQKSRDQAMRAAAIVRRIREFTRRRQPAPRDERLNEIVGDALPLVASEASRHAVRIRFSADERIAPLPIDRVLIQQIVVNLLQNAIEASAEIPGERREVRLETAASNEEVVVRVADLGAGVSDPERLFKPFFTTKPDGVGLGLCICRSLVETHGGELRYRQNAPFGSVFEFSLPLKR
jgi:hypothetical protein